MVTRPTGPPPDPRALVEEAEFARLKTQSRRFTVVVGLALAVAIGLSAWYVGGREGFGQIGGGGMNLRLLPRVGRPAPDFATTLADGERVRLSDFRGHPVWLNFWGSWCPPCRAETPDLEAAYTDLAPKGLVLLAVSLDEPPAQAFDFAARNHVTFLVSTGAAYPIANFPTHILVDKDGIVRDVVLAAIDKDEIEQHARKILPP